MKHKQEEVNTYCTTTIRNIISAQAIRAQHTAICCFWNNTVYTVTLLVSLHVRLCGLSTYIYFSCLFGPWRTSMLSRSSWCLCPFRLSFQRLTFLKLTGLSSSIQNPAKWQSSFFFFLLLSIKHDGQKCPSHFCPFGWNQRGHSWILQTVTRSPLVPFSLPSPESPWDFIRASRSARTALMQWFGTLRLPDSHADTSCELIAQYGWMDRMWWYSTSLYDRCRTVSGLSLACLPHKRTLAYFPCQVCRCSFNQILDLFDSVWLLRQRSRYSRLFKH